jgi:hypothetical protein
MGANKKLLVGYKLLFGLLGFSAIVTEIATIAARGRFNPANFFSYFTIESNVLVAAVLLVSAIATAWGKNAKLNGLRGATTVYILVVGLGFSVLLAGLENTEFTAVPWDNVVLHYIMPIAMLADFMLDRPSRQLRFAPALLWLGFPVAYAAYSLVRGAIAGWYPYPFLDPAVRGYAAVFVTIGGLVTLGIGLVWLVVKLSGWRMPRGRR